MPKSREEISRAIDKVLSQAEQDENVSSYLNSPGAVDPNVADALEAEVLREVELEQKYGNKPVEAGVGSALSAATLGISDQLLRKTGVSAERLRETRERSSGSSILGTGVGIVAPSLLSGGVSTGAKIVKGIATPLEAAAGLGKLATRGTEKLVEGRVRSNAIKEILKNAAGNAAEGSVLSVGQLVSENALGKAELNGENIVASAGAGALLGAGFGTALGSAKAVAPLLKKGIAPIAAKLSSAAKNITDPGLAAVELVNIQPAKLAEIQATRAGARFADDLPNWLSRHDMVEGDASARYLKNLAVKKAAGKQIGDAVDALDAHVLENPRVMSSADEIYNRLDDKLKEFEVGASRLKELKPENLKTIEAYRTNIQRNLLTGNNPFKGLDNLRKDYQSIEYPGLGGTQSEKYTAKIAGQLRDELRGIIDETAERISTSSLDPAIQQLANGLKTSNKDFWTASILQKPLAKKLNAKGAINLKDVIEGAAVGAATLSGPLGAAVIMGKKFGTSDLRRKAVILADIQSQSMNIAKSIKAAVSSFVKKAAKPSRQLSQKSLLNSGFAVDYETRKPAKNRDEAFKNISFNLERINNNPDLMVDQLAKSTSRIAQGAPIIAQETHNVLVRATQFLTDKLPVNPNPSLMFPREYKPSSMELAKFERYMQAIEHPISVLEDIESGTLTSEHIEAIKFVYPSIYANLQQEVLEQAMQPDSELSYNKKLQLGILLDIPTDPSLEPVNIAGLQGTFMAQNDPMQVEAQQGAIRQNQPGLQKMNMSGRAQTDTQRVASRKQEA